jgi:hypothetical protein
VDRLREGPDNALSRFRATKHMGYDIPSLDTLSKLALDQQPKQVP